MSASRPFKPSPGAESIARWYPDRTQLQDPSSVERSFRQLLTQHYDLADRFDALHQQVNAPAAAASAKAAAPPGSGPAGTQLLGLRVAPVDVQTLTNGATLKFNKKLGQFEFV